MALIANTVAATCVRTVFGALPDGRPVDALTLSNTRGISLRILTLGATVQSLIAPDRLGGRADVVLGYANAADYLGNPAYLGATLGRYANRIAGGRFSLDGIEYQLACNDGPNSLHGGTVGFGRRLWTVGDVKFGASAAVTLTLHSADGEDGFPGALTATATFELNDSQITIHYRASSDAPTIVNLSNHTYFNLSGEASGETVERHRLSINADAFLPVDEHSIPTGEVRPVGGTPFDFREPTPVGRRLRDALDPQIRLAQGYDHTWVLSGSPVAQPRRVAHLEDPLSGRVLEVLSDQPGLQFYTGNHLDATIVGKSGRAYRQSDGLSLEPQRYPDTPNRPQFGSARLGPGERYENRIIYRLSAH